mgnify:FL=1
MSENGLPIFLNDYSVLLDYEVAIGLGLKYKCRLFLHINSDTLKYDVCYFLLFSYTYKNLAARLHECDVEFYYSSFSKSVFSS